MTQRLIEREFAPSGSKQNPDLTGKSLLRTLARALSDAPAPLEAFKRRGADVVIAGNLDELVRGMNRLTPDAPLAPATITRANAAR